MPDPTKAKPQPASQDKTSDCDKNRKHTEDLLDEALAESFPASDPPSIPAPPEECE
jgi:hypothetical protein